MVGCCAPLLSSTPHSERPCPVPSKFDSPHMLDEETEGLGGRGSTAARLRQGGREILRAAPAQALWGYGSGCGGLTGPSSWPMSLSP